MKNAFLVVSQNATKLPLQMFVKVRLVGKKKAENHNQPYYSEKKVITNRR